MKNKNKIIMLAMAALLILTSFQPFDVKAIETSKDISTELSNNEEDSQTITINVSNETTESKEIDEDELSYNVLTYTDNTNKIRLTITSDDEFEKNSSAKISVIDNSLINSYIKSLNEDFLSEKNAKATGFAFPIDISYFNKDGKEEEISSPVTVKINTPQADSLKEYGLYHYKHNSTWEKINFNINVDENNNSYIEFVTDSFSPFIFVQTDEEDYTDLIDFYSIASTINESSYDYGYININKVVSGENGDKTKNFEFQIEIFSENEDVEIPYAIRYEKYTLVDGYENDFQEGYLYLDSQGKATFQLHDNQYITLYITETLRYKVIELNAEDLGYVSSVSGNSEGVIDSLEANNITFTNTRKIYELPNTGGNMDNWNNSWQVLATLTLSLMLIIAYYTSLNKKK